MQALKARVQNGRIVVNEPTDLPEGTVLELVVADPGDELDDEERAELHAALAEGLAELRAGGGVDADELLSELRARG
ncbi:MULTISPECIES: hypothetical protein [Sorangium]|uniref:hypothetical protein n=1 Tax=Sorangium TaxID=39643 RepID=UPI003D9C5C3F